MQTEMARFRSTAQLSSRPALPARKSVLRLAGRIAFFTLLCVGAFSFSTPIYAQTEATISGVLTDPSGAAVPGAALTLTNQDTSVVVQTQKSDGSGNFSFPAVPAPGSYSIAVQASGFS